MEAKRSRMMEKGAEMSIAKISRTKQHLRQILRSSRGRMKVEERARAKKQSMGRTEQQAEEKDRLAIKGNKHGGTVGAIIENGGTVGRDLQCN